MGKGSSMKSLTRIAVTLMLSCAVACMGLAVASIAPAADAGAVQQAQAKTVTLTPGTIKVKGPSLWKKKLSINTYGHTSGYYHTDFDYVLNKAGYERVSVFRVDGMATDAMPSGKIKRKYIGTLAWEIKRGEVSVTVSAFNVPYTVRQSIHGVSATKISKAKAKQLLKISTGGKITYGQLKKWSESTAKAKGKKAVKKWVGKKVIAKTVIK